MNLVIFSKRYLWSSARVLYYSTQTLAFKPRDSLYRRISPIGDPTVSIIPVLDGWIEDGNTVEKKELQVMIKQLRGYKRYKHALQVSLCISNSMWFWCFVRDVRNNSVESTWISGPGGLLAAWKSFCSWCFKSLIVDKERGRENAKGILVYGLNFFFLFCFWDSVIVSLISLLGDFHAEYFLRKMKMVSQAEEFFIVPCWHWAMFSFSLVKAFFFYFFFSNFCEADWTQEVENHFLQSYTKKFRTDLIS